jgi:hypothetical protein
MHQPKFVFVPSTKYGSKIRIALMGGPGSGKTFTALALAKHLGPNPGLVDTERKRSQKYSDLFAFHRLDLDSYDPRDLTQITLDAAVQGIDPLIVDTWSPFWTGAEGMLDQVGRAQRDFDGWRNMRPVERTMVDALLGYPGHVIVNLRVKIEYVLEKNDEGKTVPRRVGLKPEQRDGIEYEFDIVGDMADATFTVAKSMCLDLPAGQSIHKPGRDLADTITTWLERDAVGQPLNPLNIADWALEPGRTIDELRAKKEELEAVGQLNAVVFSPTQGEDFIQIGALLRNRASEIKREQQRVAAAEEAAERATNGSKAAA